MYRNSFATLAELVRTHVEDATPAEMRAAIPYDNLDSCVQHLVFQPGSNLGETADSIATAVLSHIPYASDSVVREVERNTAVQLYELAEEVADRIRDERSEREYDETPPAVSHTPDHAVSPPFSNGAAGRH